MSLLQARALLLTFAILSLLQLSSFELGYLAGFVGMAVFASVIIRRGAMPSPEEVIGGKQPQQRTLRRLGVTGAIVMIVSTWAAGPPIPLFDELRPLALLGGVGRSVILFVLVLFAQLCAVGIIKRRRLSHENFRPPVMIVVPAYNAKYVIGHTIRNIEAVPDRAPALAANAAPPARHGGRMNRKMLTLAAAGALVPQCALAQDNRVSLDGVLSYGLDVVPPDVVDTSPDQDRIRGAFDGELGVSYDAGPAVIRASAGARVFPSEGDYNRYPLTISARFDAPLSKDRRTRLRLLPSYEYVFGNDGRVFDRLRLDAQLSHRHNAANTTTFRIRYGYRNQSERRFNGYDQSEWLGELRHLWRPGGGPTRINASLLGLHANAEANRFSYNGYGTLLTARTPLTEGLEAYGRLYLVHRDYKAPFSALYPYKRKDTQLRLTGGLEKSLSRRFSLFGEAGYARNNSNVPTRRYDGFVGRIGILLRQ